MKKMILDVKVDTGEGLIKHTKGPGVRYVYSDSENNPEGNIFVSNRMVENLESPEGYVEPHSHDCESMFIFKGSNSDLSGLEVEFLLGDEWHKIKSPKVVWIPPGIDHSHRLIRGSGEYIHIALTPKGDYNKTIK